MSKAEAITAIECIVVGNKSLPLKQLNQIAEILQQYTDEVNRGILRLDEAWPLKDILSKLVGASEILLQKKDYDGHGYEEIEICVKIAKDWLKEQEDIRCKYCTTQITKGDTCFSCSIELRIEEQEEQP